MKNKRVLGFFVSSAAALVLLAGCASQPSSTSGKNAEAVVAKRAGERWNLLIDHKAGEAWEYLTPGYRQTISQAEYAARMNNRPVHWTKVSGIKAKCSDARCKVTLLVDYRLKISAGVPIAKSVAPLSETWLQEAGKWYYLPGEEGRGLPGKRR